MSANSLTTVFWAFLVCAQWQQILADHSVNSICFGDLHLDLPVRYLHIQLVENGQNLTESGGAVDVKFSKSENCRFARSVIDRFDGSYIIRFRLWWSCESIEFDAFWNGQPLCGGTVRVQRGNLLHLHPEQCYCNHKLQTTPEWIDHAECSDEPQLEKDLRRWRSIDLKEMIPSIEAKWGGEENRYSTSLCRYKFLNNQIYRHCYGEHVGFHQFSDDFFLSISEKMILPDIEFFLNLGDYPLESDLDNPLPIVSWCGSTENADIVLPTYEIVNAMMLSLDRSSLDIQAARGDTHTPWEKRKDTAVFRGRDSHELRLKIADLARKRPDLVTGGITRYFFYPKEKHSPAVESASFYDFFTHKYVISIDGTVAAYRMPYLLAGDSIILKSDSKFYEHFYSRMIPYEHYIPFDETNIEEAIMKAREADHVKICSNMNRLVMDHLQPRHIFCYYAKFFQEYYKLQNNFDSNVAGMDLVKRKVNERVYCNCAEDEKKKSEEL